MASDILRQLCPTEAELLRDPALSGVVRLRFGGPSFPPAIFFKVFVSSKGCKVKYISGRRTIHAHSEVSFFLLYLWTSLVCVADGRNAIHPCDRLDSAPPMPRRRRMPVASWASSST